MKFQSPSPAPYNTPNFSKHRASYLCLASAFTIRCLLAFSVCADSAFTSLLWSLFSPLFCVSSPMFRSKTLRNWRVATDPQLYSQHPRATAMFNRGLQTKMCFGHLAQITECKLSLLFCVAWRRQRLSRSSSDNSSKMGRMFSATRSESGVLMKSACDPMGRPRAVFFWTKHHESGPVGQLSWCWLVSVEKINN